HCFFSHHTATPPIYPLSLHDALPISSRVETGTSRSASSEVRATKGIMIVDRAMTPVIVLNARRGLTSPAKDSDRMTEYAKMPTTDRKSTRLNSSHDQISYAVFCLKKK